MWRDFLLFAEKEFFYRPLLMASACRRSSGPLPAMQEYIHFFV
jgi:hypothetical protein